MATYNNNVQSDDSGSEFSYFDEEEFDEIASIGSDISVSTISSVSTGSLSDFEDDVASDDFWTRNLRPTNFPEFTEEVGPNFTLDGSKGELDFFLKFFPVNLIEMIVAETNSYAAFRMQTKPDPKWTNTTYAEMMAFLGIYLIFSVIGLKSYTMGWKSAWPYEVPAIRQIMTRARFEKLSQYFHVNDTQGNPPRRQPGHDRMCHIRPLLDTVSRTCMENYNPHKEQSIDEGMVAYKGRLSFKQYMPGKPTKFGIKVWVRANPHNGYVHEFQVYTGKKDGVNGSVPEQGLGARVVTDLTRALVGKSHVVYMDNYFSSPQLFEQLESEKVLCCGTVRANRRGMPEAVKSVKLKNRGDSLILQKGNLVAIAWKDKKTVRFLSTSTDPTKTSTVRRRKKDGSFQEVTSPIVTEMYNKYMFGVDLADQKRVQYSTCRKAIKWWRYMFWFCFDLSIVNALICMQESPNHRIFTRNNREIKRKQLDFRMALGQQMIGTYRGSRKRRIPSNIDNCGSAHWPTQFDKPGRCKQCAKEKRRHEVSIGCKQCDVRLCIKHNCFYKYHQGLLHGTELN